MKRYKNFPQLQLHREIDPRYASMVHDRFLATSDFISRLGLYGELTGHAGCVNCLEWSHSGQILASGSDDVHIYLWDPLRKKQLANIATGHHGNIFTVKFVPNTGDRTLISGSADHSVRVHDVTAKEILSICNCHSGRVKRCITDPTTPHLFWSAGEDGIIMEHDLRTSHTCSTDSKKPKNVLIDLKSYCGYKAEAKCLAVNPIRPEFMAVGSNDPFVRIYDRRMITKTQGAPHGDVPHAAVQYLVPGHLPTKITEYKRKYRSLAATYIAYSPDGKELLVNLGGEQIYLFPLCSNLQKGITRFTIPEIPNTSNGLKDPLATSTTNGCVNGIIKNGLANVANLNIFGVIDAPSKNETENHSECSEKNKLTLAAENIKKQANRAFEAKKYARAIHLYNEALLLCPKSAILYSNRAAALLKRAWNGDAYTALKDCQTAISLDSNFDRAHLRLCRCLFDLHRYVESNGCIQEFKTRFPSKVTSLAFKALEDDLNKVLTEISARSSSTSDSSTESSPKSTTSFSTNSVTSSSSAENNDSSTIITRSRNYFLRFTRGGNDSNSSNDHENPLDEEFEFVAVDSAEEGDSSNDPSSVAQAADSSPSTSSFEGYDAPRSSDSARSHSAPLYQESELLYRSGAVDFSQRFCGHCNTTTDIKEANFFGGFVVAGSDDGSFFIWDRETTNIVKILKGDESIVNCLQPHPNYCMLATSGIESVVRVWAPNAEDGKMDDRVVEDVNDAAYANQKRMNSNPFEVILMNMGYRLNGEEDVSEEEALENSAPNMQCNPT